MDIQARCPLCGLVKIIVADSEGVKAWQSGTLIQDALPELSLDDRESLITGICPTCWREIEAEEEG